MKKVAKLVIVDKDEKYLLMYRSNHPTFGNDPDLPGGTVEEGESTLEAMIREVEEEAGINVDPTATHELYVGKSARSTVNALYVYRADVRPGIVMSWEHSSYEWLPRQEFLDKAKNANDTYMHMVYKVLSSE
ncbi:NUDIX hydrolase [Candidatus Saccharibacteria bacterium]|nr:NUDIX hydrolase [Candidatus Saccharibacteria bacterium]